MRIHLWGTDFRRSTPDFRARLFLAPGERLSRIQELLPIGFQDLVYLNTCNRVEFYTTAKDHFCDTRRLWISALKRFGLAEEDYYRGYQLEGKSALRHLLRVSCSLESLVVGEPQILGQIKEAIAWTRDQQLPLDRVLARSFQLAVETAKRARTETSLGEKPVSVASLGLQHLRSLEASYPLKAAVIVGRSAISLLVLQWLVKNRPDCPRIWVNRTVENLERFEDVRYTTVMSLFDFLKCPPPFSHLFTATSSSEPLFNSGFFEKLDGERKVLFDFAEPPDVVDTSGRVLVIRLENLMELARENSALRSQSIEQAEVLIEQALKEHCLQQKEAPLLKDFSGVEPRFWDELDEALSEIRDFPSHEQAKLRKWAQALVKKNLHTSREHLRIILRNVSEPVAGLNVD